MVTAGTARTFRPGSAIPLMVISAAIVLYLLGDAVLRSSIGEMLLLAPWPLLALWGVYVAAFVSHVTVDERGITVQNMLQIIRVPWRHVTDVRWHWQVELQLDDGGRIRAIGGPAQGRSRRRPGSSGQPPAAARRQFDGIRRAWQDAAPGASTAPAASSRPGGPDAPAPGTAAPVSGLAASDPAAPGPAVPGSTAPGSSASDSAAPDSAAPGLATSGPAASGPAAPGTAALGSTASDPAAVGPAVSSRPSAPDAPGTAAPGPTAPGPTGRDAPAPGTATPVPDPAAPDPAGSSAAVSDDRVVRRWDMPPIVVLAVLVVWAVVAVVLTGGPS